MYTVYRPQPHYRVWRPTPLYRQQQGNNTNQPTPPTWPTDPDHYTLPGNRVAVHRTPAVWDINASLHPGAQSVHLVPPPPLLPTSLTPTPHPSTRCWRASTAAGALGPGTSGRFPHGICSIIPQSGAVVVVVVTASSLSTHSWSWYKRWWVGAERSAWLVCFGLVGWRRCYLSPQTSQGQSGGYEPSHHIPLIYMAIHTPI